jgi:hypothetical protein
MKRGEGGGDTAKSNQIRGDTSHGWRGKIGKTHRPKSVGKVSER